MEKKRERGPNYSHEEKLLLANLVSKYKHIVDDKRIGGPFINKKKETWKEITQIYNSKCTATGARDVEQLKALYDNLKQKSRKIVGQNNKNDNIINKELETEIMKEEAMARALNFLREDKVEINKTGGGSWKPPTDSDEKQIAFIKDQVEPLSNPYDSAAGYFNETDNWKQYQDENYSNPVPSTPSDALEIVLNVDETNQIDPTRKELAPPTVDRRSLQKKRSPLPKKVKDNSSEELKRLYFKKKCQNAQLEHKKLRLEILYLKQQHDLTMRILKSKLSISEQN